MIIVYRINYNTNKNLYDTTRPVYVRQATKIQAGDAAFYL